MAAEEERWYQRCGVIRGQDHELHKDIELLHVQAENHDFFYILAP